VRQERPGRQIGVRRIDDPQHPRGYRELRSNGASALRKSEPLVFGRSVPGQEQDWER
jgi:hypothetical protein